MTRASSARRLLLPLVPLYRLALALRELRLASDWSLSGACAFRSSASEVSPPADRGRPL